MLSLNLRRRAIDPEGATAAEYAIMVSLIAAVIVVVVTVLGENVVDLFQDTVDAIADGVFGG